MPVKQQAAACKAVVLRVLDLLPGGPFGGPRPVDLWVPEGPLQRRHGLAAVDAAPVPVLQLGHFLHYGPVLLGQVLEDRQSVFTAFRHLGHLAEAVQQPRHRHVLAAHVRGPVAPVADDGRLVDLALGVGEALPVVGARHVQLAVAGVNVEGGLAPPDQGVHRQLGVVLHVGWRPGTTRNPARWPGCAPAGRPRPAWRGRPGDPPAAEAALQARGSWTGGTPGTGPPRPAPEALGHWDEVVQLAGAGLDGRAALGALVMLALQHLLPVCGAGESWRCAKASCAAPARRWPR